MLPLSLTAAAPVSACTGCGIDGSEMAAQATTIELLRFAGAAGVDPDLGPLATFREVALMKGHRIASINLPIWNLSAGYRRHRLLLLRVPNWGDITRSVSASGAVEPWAEGEGEPGPYPLTLAGWYALIATAPDTATAPDAPRPGTSGSPILLVAAGGFGALFAFRRTASRARRAG